MSYTSRDVETSILELTGMLGLAYPHPLQAEYENGRHPDLLSYEKLQASGSHLAPIERYVIGASSYLRQPRQFYDIFRACRHVSLIQPLASAIKQLKHSDVKGLDNRLNALVHAKSYDAFESVLFEIVVAWRYLCSEGVRNVEFIEATPSQRTSDLAVDLKGIGESFCECKKLDRTSEFSVRIRKDVRDLLTPIIRGYRKSGQSFVGGVVFFSEPSGISGGQLEDAVHTDMTSFFRAA